MCMSISSRTWSGKSDSKICGKIDGPFQVPCIDMTSYRYPNPYCLSWSSIIRLVLIAQSKFLMCVSVSIYDFKDKVARQK